MQKVVVITGANAGIGFQTALKFAADGAKVVMACRSMERGRAAQQRILDSVPQGDVVLMQLDVSDLGSVHAFVAEFSRQIGLLDILINNAGIVAIPLTRNSAGHEMQLATNYLGAFALTGLMLPFFRKEEFRKEGIRKEGGLRIVNVGSLAHRLGKLTVDDLNWEKSNYNQWQAYARSKVAMLSYTLELNRRLQAAGSNIIALAAHPGFANTDINKNSAALTPKNPLGKWLQGKTEKLIPRAADAARPIILAASADTVAGGDYYGPRGFLEIGGKPGKAKINPVARDSALGNKLWAVSEAMTGVQYLSGI